MRVSDGPPEGLALGVALGEALGVLVGPPEGYTLGVALGEALGEALGVSVGPPEGARLGVPGLAVGFDMGLDVGPETGLDTGLDVGLDVGLDTGLETGLGSFVAGASSSTVSDAGAGVGVVGGRTDSQLSPPKLVGQVQVYESSSTTTSQFPPFKHGLLGEHRLLISSQLVPDQPGSQVQAYVPSLF